MTQPTQVSGTIKPLEWHKSHVKPWKDDYHTVPTGYTIRWVGEYEWKWSGAGGFGYSTSPEAAKSAAQADYEARIAAQIEQDPEVQPVAWRYRSIDKPTVWSHLTDHRRTVYGRIGMEEQPLYAQPAPCASKSAESDPQPALSVESEPQAIQSSDLVSMEAAISVAKEAISKIVYDQWFKSHYPVTSHAHQYVGEAVEDAIRALPAACAEVSVAEAARVLLGDGGMMPTPAKLAAVKAHLQRDSRVQPVAIIEAWNAALRALAEAG